MPIRTSKWCKKRGATNILPTVNTQGTQYSSTFCTHFPIIIATLFIYYLYWEKSQDRVIKLKLKKCCDFNPKPTWTNVAFYRTHRVVHVIHILWRTWKYCKAPPAILSSRVWFSYFKNKFLDVVKRNERWIKLFLNY